MANFDGKPCPILSHLLDLIALNRSGGSPSSAPTLAHPCGFAVANSPINATGVRAVPRLLANETHPAGAA